MADDDLYKAMAAFMMCFARGLPNEVKLQIRADALRLAQQIEHGGEPNVSKLTRGLADALVTDLPIH